MWCSRVFLLVSMATLSHTGLAETHPYQDHLRCEPGSGSSLKGVLFDVSGGQNRRLGEFISGHMGSCEKALRASRGGVVCVHQNWTYTAIEIATGQIVQRFGSDIEECADFTRNWSGLETRPGYVEFIDADELQAITKNLPRVANSDIDAVVHAADTMWYDEASLIFTYQDSFGRPEGPEGLRANRVGYDVGSTTSIPDIRALTEYFKHGKFRFPFSIAAGNDMAEDVYILNFWAPPTKDGEKLPVTWWKNGSHWHWVFPVGTVIGEVLTLRAPDDGENYIFEIRARERRIDGWTTYIFRPFAEANEMAAAIRAKRPNWQSTDLAALVEHLEKTTNMVPAQLSTVPYDDIVAPLNGFHDYLPATTDYALLKQFLSQNVFVSAMNKTWKQQGRQQAFAASTKADFHIVPRDYIGGLLETSEEACQSCHDQAGRPIGQLDYRVTLYGEIWGEDQIFTWHPFAVSTDAYTVTDGNRRVNPRMAAAGLLIQKEPTAGDLYYRELPRPYNPDYTSFHKMK